MAFETEGQWFKSWMRQATGSNKLKPTVIDKGKPFHYSRRVKTIVVEFQAAIPCQI